MKTTDDIRDFSLEIEGFKSEFDTSSYIFCPKLLVPPGKKKNSKIKNKKRFSDEQIKSLESIFESETTKLEAKKKLELAKELDLTPRQVSIWFQNKRARWKSKQIEKGYIRLRADYDNLASRFDSLMKEKQSLLEQLPMLREMLGKPEEKEWSCKATEAASGSREGGSDHEGQAKYEPEDSKISPSDQGISLEQREELVVSHDNINIPVYRSIVPSPHDHNLYDLVSDYPSNVPFTNPHWLNFWI